MEIARDSTIRLPHEVWFDTCFGHFEGTLPLEPKRDARAQQLLAD